MTGGNEREGLQWVWLKMMMAGPLSDTWPHLH